MTYDAGRARGVYELDIRPFERGVQTALSRYATLEQAARRALQARPILPAPALGPIRPTTDTGDAAASRAAQIRAIEQALSRQATAERAALRSSQQLADSEIRAARAGGDHTRALQLIDAQLARTAQNTTRYNNLLAQQARAQQAASRASTGGDLGPALPRTFAGFSGLAGTVAGVAGLVGSVTALVAATQQAIALGTQVRKVDRSFQQLATQGTQTGDALLRALRTGAAGEIDDLNLKLAANRANLLGVAKSADEFAKLFQIARARAEALGTDTTTAFNDLVTGLGRGSPLILDNLGITVKLGEANEQYAKSLGKTASALTDAEKKQALINAVLAQAGSLPAPPIDTYAALAATFATIQQNASQAVAGGLEPAARGLDRLLQAAQGNITALAELRASLRNLGNEQAGVDPAALAREREAVIRGRLAGDLSRGMRQTENRNAAIGGLTGGSPEFAAVQQQYAALEAQAIQLATTNDQTAASVQRVVAAYAQSGDLAVFAGQLSFIQAAQDRANQTTQRAIPGYLQQAEATRAAAAASQQAALAQQAETDQLVQSIQQQQQAALAEQEHAQVKDALEQAAYRVAIGLTTEADEAARLGQLFPALAGQFGPLIAGQLQLAAATDAVTQALTAQRLAAQAANTKSLTGPTGIVVGAPGRKGNTLDDYDRFIADQAAAEAARRRQIEATGTAAQQAALYQDEYNRAVKRFGADSAQAIDAQTKLRQLEQAQGARSRTPRAPAPPRTTGSGRTTEAQRTLTEQRALTEQLAVIDRQLADGTRKDAARNRLLEERAQIMDRIAELQERQAEAANRAALATVNDQISRLKEARELERLQAVQQDMRFSAEQREAARLRAEQIALEQQQRGLEIARQTRDAGGRVPGVGAPPPSVTRPTIIPGQTAPLPIPKVEALPVLPTGFTIPTPQLTIERLIIQMDSTGQGRVITPQPGVNILSVLVQASQTVQSGG